jgi:O-antigen/teichoic acid export membrane protein
MLNALQVIALWHGKEKGRRMTDSDSKESKDGGQFLSREVLKSVPWVVGARLILFFVSFGVSIVIVNGLGRELYGVYKLAMLAAEYSILVCSLGLNTALMRFIPELRVKKSRAGLIRLLFKSILAQSVMLVLLGILLYVLKPLIDTYFFKSDSHFLLTLVVLLALGRLGRAFCDDVMTAMFRMQAVSILAVIHGILLLSVVFAALKYNPTPAAAMVAQSVSVLVIAVCGAVILFRLLRGLDWHESHEGIGTKRVLGIAFPRQLTQMSSLITQRYSEVFFIGFFFTPEIVADYELGNWFPFILITFLPQSVQNLFTSGFAEAYSRDPRCLGRLVSTYFKTLILLVVPVSAFGAFFAPDIIPAIYGEEMAAAGQVASAFFVIHLLSLISTPLGVAIITKEKSMQMQPLLIMMIIVNLAFDWFLISRYGITGACIAVVATFAVTIPIRLYIVSRLIGGVFFPMRFFLKMLVVLFGLALGLHTLVDAPGFFGIAGLGIAYLIIYCLLLRWLRLIHSDDVAELRAMGFSKVNRVLALVVAPEKS